MSAANKFNFMTSHNVMITNKLYLDDRNNEYFILCKFGSRTTSGYRVAGIEPPLILVLYRITESTRSFDITFF